MGRLGCRASRVATIRKRHLSSGPQRSSSEQYRYCPRAFGKAFAGPLTSRLVGARRGLQPPGPRLGPTPGRRARQPRAQSAGRLNRRAPHPRKKVHPPAPSVATSRRRWRRSHHDRGRPRLPQPALLGALQASRARGAEGPGLLSRQSTTDQSLDTRAAGTPLPSPGRDRGRRRVATTAQCLKQR